MNFIELLYDKDKTQRKPNPIVPNWKVIFQNKSVDISSNTYFKTNILFDSRYFLEHDGANFKFPQVCLRF